MACHQLDIQQEYIRNITLKREDIEKLRQHVETRAHPFTSDVQLFLFLHSCYYNVENAKSTIDSYYDLRSSWPEVFKNRDPSASPLKEQLNVSVVWPLKSCTSDGYRIFFLKVMDSDASKYDTYEQLKMCFATMEFWLNVFGNAKGFILILDAKDSTWAHLPKYGINTIRKIIAYVQDAFPIRLKGVHYINAWSLIEKILFLARPFMKKELHEIVHVHSDFESLYEYVPQNCLPKDYGGDDVTIRELQDDMIKTLLQNSHQFTEGQDNEQLVYHF